MLFCWPLRLKYSAAIWLNSVNKDENQGFRGNRSSKSRDLEVNHPIWPRRTMDSIRVSEAPDTGSIPVEAT